MPSAPTYLDYLSLACWAEQARAGYASAEPFPHVVTTTFLRPEVVAAAIDEFPNPAQLDDWRTNDARDREGRIAQVLKLGHSNELRFGPTLRGLLYELNSGPFLRILEHLTGIPGLIADPHLVGGGLHQYLAGAVLRVHADFNVHPNFGLDRRLNLLLYLNDDWDSAWGGDLELWDRTMSRCVRRVPPLANTCVIFSTTHDSYHGVPDPLRTPEGRTRKSLALYYYSNGRPAHEQRPPHSTLWQARPNE